jgi:hypothetical protein
MEDGHQRHVKAAHLTCELISTQILPILRTLAAEVRKRLTEAEVEWQALDKELARDRVSFLRLTAHLRVALDRIYEPDAALPADAATIPRDPWVAASRTWMCSVEGLRALRAAPRALVPTRSRVR